MCVDQSGQIEGSGNEIPHPPIGSLAVGTESEMSPVGSGFNPYSLSGGNILGGCESFRKFGVALEGSTWSLVPGPLSAF